jgi:hypothetical protein
MLCFAFEPERPTWEMLERRMGEGFTANAIRQVHTRPPTASNSLLHQNIGSVTFAQLLSSLLLPFHLSHLKTQPVPNIFLPHHDSVYHLSKQSQLLSPCLPSGNLPLREIFSSSSSLR